MPGASDMKNLTDTEYAEMVKKASPSSKSIKTIPLAFLVGGAICALGEGLARLFVYLGADEELAYALVSISLVFLASLLTALNLYDDIAKIGGAGARVPITGFANAVVAPALEYRTEGFVLGVGVKLFAIAGPVIVYGISSGVVYGFILWLFRLY
jgi:stage V sporulation protein AC